MRTGGFDTREHGGGVRPVLGIVDDGVGKLEGKGEALEHCFDDKDIGDGGINVRVRRSAERINGLEAGGERREKVGECHWTCSANDGAGIVANDTLFQWSKLVKCKLWK